MKLSIKYQDLDWWFWAAILVTIGLGILGVSWGFWAAFWTSIANLAYYVVKDRSLTSFPVQVREVWLVFMLLAMWPPLSWFYYLLFVGMILVVFFDRCGIARVLAMMPWNKSPSIT